MKRDVGGVLGFVFIYFIIPFDKFWPPHFGQGYSSRKSSATQFYKCLLGHFRVSVIHRTLTWTTGSQGEL